MSRHLLSIGLIGIVLILSACAGNGSSPAAPTPTAPPTATTAPTNTAAPPTATNTVAPTDTPVPTHTVPPTDTPAPTVTPTPTTAPPNIVFIIMDDVGIDQLEAFGLGQGLLASTPNLDALAHAGVRFSNMWSMPECSPSRATIFTGRYPLRTGVTSALLPNMLPQAQVSPYETTLPRVLAQAGYTSAMVGKYHLGNRNPAGNCAPRTLGFDYFDGNMEAGPPAIDFQAGHVEDGAADRPDRAASISAMRRATATSRTAPAAPMSCPYRRPTAGPNRQPVTGRSCMEAGGIFVEETGRLPGHVLRRLPG